MIDPASIDRKAAAPLPVVARREDLAWFDAIAGERSAIHVDAQQSGGAFCIIESVLMPGAALPRHYHREAEVFFIIEGVVTIEVDRIVHRAVPGTTVTVPPGVTHAWKNATAYPARLLATFTPGGIEAMFPLIAGKTAVQLAALAATYGTHVVGPPID